MILEGQVTRGEKGRHRPLARISGSPLNQMGSRLAETENIDRVLCKYSGQRACRIWYMWHELNEVGELVRRRYSGGGVKTSPLDVQGVEEGPAG